MPDWELVLRRPGKPDEVVSMSADNLLTGVEFMREGVDWVITKDDGPSSIPGHVVRMICEPKPEAHQKPTDR